MLRILILLFFGAGSAYAQNKQVLYGLTEIPQTLMLNPGSEVDFISHFGIPFLSHIHINAGASGVSTFDIFGKSSVDINTRIRNQIFEMENTDFFTATQQLELINFGWRGNRSGNYYSAGIYEEFDFIAYFPKDLAILAFEGNQDYIGKEFDLGEINTTADLLTVYHFGINKKIDGKLTIGARLKLYSSIFNYKSTDNQGTFITRITDDGPNIYEHRLENADFSVQTSGYASLRELDGSNEVLKEVAGNAFFGGNIGLGLDIGATYKFNERVTLSGSLIDVGAIFHGKDTETYRARGNYTLDGIELQFPPAGDNENNTPYYSNLLDDIERAVPYDTINDSYAQLRPIKANAAVSYSFGRELGRNGPCNCLMMGDDRKINQSAGLQMFSVLRNKGPQFAATAFYYRRFANFLSAKFTYTADPYSYSNVGFGLVADIGALNFYVTTDNILSYGNIAKAKKVSLQLGFNLKFDE